MQSRTFRFIGFVASIASLGAQTASVAAEVGWSPPTPTATASTLWLNDAAGSSTLGQGMLQLNGPAESFVLTDPSTATHTGLLTLTGTVPAFRTSVATGSQDSIVGMNIGSGDPQINNAGRTVVNSLVADAATDISQITKTSRGTLLLDDASTYSGATTLFDGSLAAGNGKSFASGAPGLNGGAISSPDFPASPSRTFANSASVGSTMTFGDTLSPVNTGFSSGIDLQGAVRTFTTSSNVTFDGVVANGAISKSGAAALTLTGINSYAGGTTLTEGTLFAANNSALGTGPLALGSTSSPTISSDASGASAARTFANDVSVNGNVTFGDGSNNGAMLFASSANLGNAGETRTFTVNAKTTFSGEVSGGAGLTKAGSGVLTLSGSNSYSGGTTFASGMLSAGSNGSFGTGAMTFAGGAIGSADSTPRSFANSMVFLGDLTIGNYIDSMGALTFTSQVDLGNTDRRLTTKSDATFTGAIANGSITKDGLGALVLSGSNSYGGGTTLLEGTLLAGSDQAFGSGMMSLNGGIIGSASGQRSFSNAVSVVGEAVQFGDSEHLASLLFTGSTALAAGQKTFNTVADTTFTGILAGSGASLIKTGDGILTLTNANTYDGGTTLAVGTLLAGSDQAFGSGMMNLNGGVIGSASGQRSFANALSMIGGPVQFGDSEHLASLLFTGSTALAAGQKTFNTVADTTFTGILAGSGASLIKTGDGILTLTNANTYDGGTTLAVGTLLAGSDQAFGSGMMNLNGGVIGSASGQRSFANALSMIGGPVQFGDSEHLASLLFTGSTALAAGQKTFNTVADTTFTGILAGSGASLIKTGDGILTLTNANTYDGGTQIQDGAIRIANDAALGRGAITFSGGVLASTTSDNRGIYNDVTFNGGATIGDGSSNGAFVFNGANNTLASGAQTITTNVATAFANGISGAGGLTKSGLSTLTLKGANTYTGDTIVQSGKLVLDGSIVGSKEIRLAAGAVLGGDGRFDGTISGYGSVDPGNSPGILSASSVTISTETTPPSGDGQALQNGTGMSFSFEFTQLGAPTWSNAAASGNDVLLLTGSPAFSTALTSANNVNLYFDANLTSSFTTSAWQTVQGGFFTVDTTNSLASAIAGASYSYYFETNDSGSYPTFFYNGQSYVTESAARSLGLLPNGGQSFVVREATVASANFDARLSIGTVTGLTMEIASVPRRSSRGAIIAVPEPSTWVMGLMAAGMALARRRRLAGLLARLRRSIPL